MTFNGFAKKLGKFLKLAAEAARKAGHGDVRFTWTDLANYYHVHGVKATGPGFGRYLVQKKERQTRRKNKDIKKVSPRRRIK
jgi:hypothetical protein